MLIYPAIDILGGKAVRLLRGDYSSVTVYGDEPSSTAEYFSSCGAKAIHIVDLDGARTGRSVNMGTIRKIVERKDLFCEVGGGIRSMAAIEDYLGAGAGRVILSTAALENRKFLAEAVASFKEKIAVGVDMKNGHVAAEGWIRESDTDVFRFLEELEDIGIGTVIFTDTMRDGAMTGIDTELYRRLNERFSFDIIASGGVKSLADLEKLSQTGIHGSITGKAVYTGAIDLREAIRLIER